MSSEDQHGRRDHRGRFKGLFTHSKNGVGASSASNALHTHGKAISSRTGHPIRTSEAADFLPNPQISSSPGGSSPHKKVWEGAYKNFLTRGKSKSPSTVSAEDRSPSSLSSENSKSLRSETNKKKGTGFSILPGSRRLVTKSTPTSHHPLVGELRTQSVTEFPTSHGEQQQQMHGMPNLPALSARHRSLDEMKGMSGDAQSENAVRGGSYFKSMFSPHPGKEKLRHHRRTFSQTDDLDAPLRKGVDKSTLSPQQKRISYEMDMEMGGSISRTISEGEQDNVGLDYLLESAAVSPPHLFDGPRRSHVKSYSQKHLAMPHPFPPPMQPRRASSVPETNGTVIIETSQGTGIPLFVPQSQARQLGSAMNSHHGGGVGSLLSQQLEQQERDELEGYPEVPTQLSSSPNTLASYLSDPGFIVNSSPSSAVYQQYQAIDPETKKMFTMYHNDSRFNRDSTEPFLGGDVPSSSRTYPDMSYSLTMKQGAGTSVSRPRMHLPMSSGSSLQLQPVDEQSLLIQNNLRLLKPVQGCDSWQNGRRYLIGAAAMATCPVAVVDKLAGTIQRTAEEAVSSPVCFGTINLGEALITYVGERHQLSLGKWSSCALTLRQNYLLEYGTEAAPSSLPRGFAHLQHAVAYASPEFPDSLELHFFASPCAKADPRVLMIRVNKREERDDWVHCLNRAAQLQVTDLYDVEMEAEFGRGRYASVRPARRKDHAYFEQEDRVQEDKSLQEKCNCALKVVDKNEFWKRVVKGRERADTLVRELSVQSTLTAKCGRISTFLKLRSFFETSDNVVLELELLEGTDLFDYISKKGMMSEKEAAVITYDILQSLEAMNRVGVAHRDVKPANILMCDREKDNVSVKIGDFGMSTFVGVDGLLRGRCGTPGYVAPEILTSSSGAGYGNRVDVFSAGVILYVMLCGYEPFYGESELALIEANKRAIVDFPEGDWQDVSDEARDLIQQMLKADPMERISAREALEHPWVVAFRKNEKVLPRTETESGLSKSLVLPTSDVPDAGACADVDGKDLGLLVHANPGVYAVLCSTSRKMTPSQNLDSSVGTKLRETRTVD
eukprot:scaffold2794_cov100-Cylindrotheca_fusiformis.AAC.6